MRNTALLAGLLCLLFSSVCCGLVGTPSWQQKSSLVVLDTFFAFSPQGVAFTQPTGPSVSAQQEIVFSGKTILRRCTYHPTPSMSFPTVGANYDPLSAVQSLGYNHIGDIDIFEATLYAPVEEDSYTRPAIVFYNASELNMPYLTHVETHQMHMPWVAVDADTRVLYSSEFDNVTYLYAYNVDKLDAGFVRVNLTLDATVPPQGMMAVQGGVVYKGYLYLSTSSPGDPVYAVDLSTGVASLLFHIDSTNETEGIAVGDDGLMYIVVANKYDATIFQYSEVARW